MGRRIRCLLAGHLVEVTCRTIQGRFLMRPSSGVNLAIKGTLGRAQRYAGLRVVLCVFLSNHYHLLVIPDSEQQLASFMKFLNTNLSKQLGRLHGWAGTMFNPRYQAIPISDEEEAQVARMRYLLEHGVKEGLVQRPGEWPGVQCVTELTRGPNRLRGIWRGGKSLPPEERNTRETLELSPPPAWEARPLKQRSEAVLKIVRDVEKRSLKALAETGSRPLGERAILSQNPHDRPRVMKRSPAPIAHAATIETWLAMKTAYWEFVAAYREAVAQWRESPGATFPAGCFPPRVFFIARAGPAWA